MRPLLVLAALLAPLPALAQPVRPVRPVPEPSTALLLAAGLAAFAVLRR